MNANNMPAWSDEWTLDTLVTGRFVQSVQAWGDARFVNPVAVNETLLACARQVEHAIAFTTPDHFGWMVDAFPRLAWEWCFWHDHGIAAPHILGLMERLVSEFLNLNIQARGLGYPFRAHVVRSTVRAIRDRTHPHTRGIPWMDEQI